tara:strand:- start:798 stop:1970 length:1173 start_codon:yes stop_codon:yes gene_type:complete
MKFIILLSLLKPILSITNEQKLYDNLFNNYDKRVRPVKNFNDSINTKFSLKINSLEFFHQPEEKIKFNVELDLYWKDEFLSWNFSEFNNAKSLNINPDRIWTPDIELYNSGGYPEIWTKNLESKVDYNGNVFLSIPVLLTFSCFLELRDFPFDKQVCELSFGSWKFSKKYLDIRVLNDSNTQIINYDNFNHNEWNIISVSGKTDNIEYKCCPGDYFPTSTLSIELERKYTKYTIVIIMTLILTLSSINVVLLSMSKYRRTFILVFIPLTIIWVQLDIAGKNPVIEYPTKMENILMTCYYVCIICAFYSGIIFCILTNELSILEKFGIKKYIKKNYNIKPINTNLVYYFNNNETVDKKYFNFRRKIKLVDNIIKISILLGFISSIIIIIYY